MGVGLAIQQESGGIRSVLAWCAGREQKACTGQWLTGLVGKAQDQQAARVVDMHARRKRSGRFQFDLVGIARGIFLVERIAESGVVGGVRVARQRTMVCDGPGCGARRGCLARPECATSGSMLKAQRGPRVTIQRQRVRPVARARLRAKGPHVGH